jgi:DNA-3-methyladenine glycosylase II
MTATGVATVPVLRPMHPAACSSSGEHMRMRSYSTVMTDHPAWNPDGSTLIRALPAGDHALARTDTETVTWCCPQAAASAPRPGMFSLPESAARDVPELAAALGSLRTVARFANPSLWDAIGTAIIRQVVRAAQARAQYQALCTAHGFQVRCGAVADWLFPSPETVLSLRDAQFAAVGLAFKRDALRTAAAAYTEHGREWAAMPASGLVPALLAVRRVGPWTAGAAVADWANDFAAYPCGDLAVRTWAAHAAPSAAWPRDEPGFDRRWRQVAGPHLADLTLLTLTWGGRHARANSSST